MGKTILYFASLLFCLSLTPEFAQAQVVDLDNFDEIKVSTSISVHLIPSNENRAEVNMLKGDFDKLVMEIEEGRLKMKFKSKKWGLGGNNGKAEIDLYYKTLTGIDLSAGAKVTSDSRIKADKFEIEASSGSSCYVEVESTKMEVDISSGSRVELKGFAEDLKVESSSGSSFNGFNFEADHVNADSSSGSSISVYANKSLSAEASSGSSVRYKGEPTKTDLDASKYSGGSISKVKGRK